MKLQTSIPPRRDGTITVIAKDGKRIVFAPSPEGDLVGDVTDEATVVDLLNGGLFFPADPADFDRAMLLAGKVKDADSGDGDQDDDDEEEKLDPDALPKEANTPPADKPAKKAK